jgi:hypothetical protein
MEKKHFTVTADHIKLLRRMNVGWQDGEAGAPEIDPKRPYGNGYVPGDIHEILTGKWCDNELSAEEQRRYLNLHRETETALQVILATGSFKPGHFECDPNHPNWKRIVARSKSQLP